MRVQGCFAAVTSIFAILQDSHSILIINDIVLLSAQTHEPPEASKPLNPEPMNPFSSFSSKCIR